MATLVKHHPEQVPKTASMVVGSVYPLPCKQLAIDVADQHHYLQGCSSPKSVIGGRVPSGNSSYYFSCSSSSSAERASTMTDPQHQGPRPLHLLDSHLAGYNKLKLLSSQQHYLKASSSLQQMTGSNSSMNTSLSLNLKKVHPESGQQGCHRALNDVGPQKEFSSHRQQQQLVNTPPSWQSKPYGYYVTHNAKGFPLTSEEEAVSKSYLCRSQATPINSLINTLMQQYQPPVLVADSKTSCHQSLNEVFADVGHGSFVADPKQAKLFASRGDEKDKWTHTKVSAMHLTRNGSTQNVPLLKLSHEDHTSSVMSLEQESFSLHQPSYNKVQLNTFEFQPRPVQADPSIWGEETLQNEVEKLTDAVNCAQACLERIQPIPAPRNKIDPFIGQGLFWNRLDRIMPQGALQHNANADLQMLKTARGNSHNPVASTLERDLFLAPKKFEKLHQAHNGNGLPETPASQKHHQRPIGPQNCVAKPWLKDDSFSNVGEHFHVQRPDKNGHARSSTSRMMDASTEITPTTSHRDMGTQMTPIGSSWRSSHPHSPHRGTPLSPPRHNTPMKTPASVVWTVNTLNGTEAETHHKAKLGLVDTSSAGDRRLQQSLGKSFDSNWSSREEEEEDISKSLRQLDLEDHKKDVLEARASAWKEATRLKVLARYEREETKIRAWEDVQAAKAEADLKKLEMKLEKERMRMAAKIASKLDAAHRKAEERRAAAKVHSLEALEKTASKIHHESTLSHHNANHPLCACFSQSFG